MDIVLSSASHHAMLFAFLAEKVKTKLQKFIKKFK